MEHLSNEPLHAEIARRSNETARLHFLKEQEENAEKGRKLKELGVRFLSPPTYTQVGAPDRTYAQYLQHMLDVAMEERERVDKLPEHERSMEVMAFDFFYSDEFNEIQKTLDDDLESHVLFQSAQGAARSFRVLDSFLFNEHEKFMKAQQQMQQYKNNHPRFEKEAS